MILKAECVKERIQIIELENIYKRINELEDITEKRTKAKKQTNFFDQKLEAFDKK